MTRVTRKAALIGAALRGCAVDRSAPTRAALRLSRLKAVLR